MSKRNLLSTNSSSKKPRVEELGDFWDDDFDGDAIEDCFLKATQQQNEPNDVSLLSSYTIFQEQKCIFTSTQTTTAGPNTMGNLEIRLKELQEKYAEKEGEVSILRSNLQNLKANYDSEQKQKQLEWKDKLNAIDKENKAIKSELEFKNFEIVNLKQQIAELSRIVNAEQNSTQKAQILERKLSATENQAIPINKNNCKIYISVENYNPLKFCNFSFLLKMFQRLQQQHQSHGDNINDQIGDSNEISLDFTSLSVSRNLNIDSSIVYINKVMAFSVELLKTFSGLLTERKADWDVHADESGLHYLSNKRIKEASFLCAEVIIFFGEIVPFNENLRKFLFSTQTTFIDNSNYKMKNNKSPNYLIQLSYLISMIRELDKETECQNFVIAVLKLYCRIFNVESLESRKSTIEEILRELLTSKKQSLFAHQMNLFLNIITRHPNIVQMLCPNNEEKTEQECCRFITFIEDLETSLKSNENGEFYLDMSSSVLNLMYNIFKANNEWLFQQDNKRCGCLHKLCKLAIVVIYKQLELKKNNSNKNYFIRKIIKILSLLNSNAYDLTQKYISDFASFKEIVYKLIRSDFDNQSYARQIENLSPIEDYPQIPKERFLKIDL